MMASVSAPSRYTAFAELIAEFCAQALSQSVPARFTGR